MEETEYIIYGPYQWLFFAMFFITALLSLFQSQTKEQGSGAATTASRSAYASCSTYDAKNSFSFVIP